MKPAPFDYVAPKTIDEALIVLAEADGGATLLAGGQTLAPLLALRMSTPSLVVDINRIAALTGVERTADGVRFGAMMRQSEVIEAPLAATLPAVVTAVSHIGHHQTRNRGTIGGSIALGDPAAELPATAVALGAMIEARSRRGVRQIAAAEFYLAPYSTRLEPDELVTAVTFPEWPSGSAGIFREIAMRAGDFALVGLVGAIAVEQGKIMRAGLAWFGMGPTPMKARQAGAALVGQAVDGVDLQRMADLAIADADPFDDRHATAEYRKDVGRMACVRALGEALKVREAA